ncbi:MAG: hypothetical protein AABP62_18185, partial [Planctomycetota bacterium]
MTNTNSRTINRDSEFSQGHHGQRRRRIRWASLVAAVMIVGFVSTEAVDAAPLLAGVAKVDITNVDAGPVND